MEKALPYQSRNDCIVVPRKADLLDRSSIETKDGSCDGQQAEYDRYGVKGAWCVSHRNGLWAEGLWA